MKIILDASAWIEYFIDSAHALKVEQKIKEHACITLSITLAEVVAKIIRWGSESEETITAIKTLSTIVPAEEETAIAAAHIYAKMRRTRKKFSLSNAFLVAYAKKINAKILTKDTDFSGLPEAIMLK